MNKIPKILVSGNTTLDVITICDGPYNASGKRPVTEYKQVPGGQAANVADLLARLGNNVSFVGAIGNDSAGNTVVEDFREAGIELSHSKFCHAPHHLGFVRVDRSDGERLIDMYKASDLNCDGIQLSETWVQQFDCIYIDGHEPALAQELGRMGRKLGIPVVADLEEISPSTDCMLENVDVLIAPAKIIQKLGQSNNVEQALKNLVCRGYSNVVATMGPDGCIGVSSIGSKITVLGIPIKAVDTTGAGDAFHGAFVHAMVNGSDFADSLILANQIAAQKCSFVGPRLPAEITKSLNPKRRGTYVKREWLRDDAAPGR